MFSSEGLELLSGRDGTLLVRKYLRREVRFRCRAQLNEDVVDHEHT